MEHQQRAAAKQYDVSNVPGDVAQAATRYQAFREIEAEHLGLMASHSLLEDWTPEIRLTVLAARDKVRRVREARDGFRGQVRGFVRTLRTRQEPLSAALRLTRAMLELLEREGAIRNDEGWLEAEVLEWVIEDYERIS